MSCFPACPPTNLPACPPAPPNLPACPPADKVWVPCSPDDAGSKELSLQYFADNDLASKVLPPPITMRDFEKVMLRARPTVGKSDLEIFERFTAEFGEVRGGGIWAVRAGQDGVGCVGWADVWTAYVGWCLYWVV